MTVHISIPLDEEQVARLDAIAAAKSASTADVVAEAVASFLEHEAWFVAGVEEGLAQKAAGMSLTWARSWTTFAPAWAGTVRRGEGSLYQTRPG